MGGYRFGSRFLRRRAHVDASCLPAEAPVDVVLGTKAQYIKMAPVLAAFDAREVPYRLIHTAQHHGIVERISDDFALRRPDLWLSNGQNDPENVRALGSWLVDCIWTALRLAPTERAGASRVLLVHGDTPSTAVGVITGLLWGRSIGHIESGLRSFSLLEPFPEELIRRFTMYWSDILFCPSRAAAQNVSRHRARKLIVDTGFNTVFDAIRLIQQRGAAEHCAIAPAPPYVVGLFHRQETLYSRERLERALASIELVASRFPVEFILHTPTRFRLAKLGLEGRLRSIPNVRVHSYLGYARFMDLVSRSEFVVTDGGGLQEETYFLNKPCLLLRNRSERDIGLGDTACLGGLDPQVVELFLKNYESYRRPQIADFESPSDVIARVFAGLQWTRTKHMGA